MRKLEATASKAGRRWSSECGCTGMSLLDFKQPASVRATFKETLLAVIMKLCLDVHCDGLPISSKWAETNECLEGRKSIQQLNVQKMVGKDGKCTHFAVCSINEIRQYILEHCGDPHFVQLWLSWLSTTCQQCSHWGEERDRRTLLEVMVIDWIVSAPLLFSDQCPTIYHFLSACLFLLPLTPTSVLPHTSCCPLFTVFCRMLSQAVPHPLPLSVSISLLAIYHPGPFKSIQ